MEAQELLARWRSKTTTIKRAADEANKALAIDPNAVQAQGHSGHHRLAGGKKETPWDPHDARGYEIAGHFFVLNRRYEEGIEYYRKAIALDPHLYTRAFAVGINLMRLGQDGRGLQANSRSATTTATRTRHQQLAAPDGQLQELRHLQDATTPS